ncbi:MAG: rhamnulose-1-phosphate aldolase [Bacteroidaceae bacterium]|jgi:rhamnulose-1-phosphate aldolase|nr:rhamnulose-1-phosphate aldolase [Bacteroidaceae bacterium]MBQ2341239.1 rhamnulose-1-phosphate aldolase [Bacteroidaceae bacterium]MBQ6050787.1 rhamnulose-1-phosphate aldolase [Bacteroidaceae bacterium]MBQ6085077.1 rhamnulose-1-phosphate aldolase [Bacteroidaceae bacterium]MBR3545985.1 rhamnulose-1-phosphate aldolase [Bacteroidaceae bacterium]
MSVLDNRPNLKAVIDQVAEVTGYLWQKGWAERNGGNITVNITKLVDDEIRALPALAPVMQIGKVLPCLQGKFFYVKGTGKRMRDLARWPMQNGSIIRICEDCASYEIIADEPVIPTSELPSHLALQNYLLETGSSYKATLHTHPIELVAMSHIKRFLKEGEMTRVLWSMIPETLAFAPLGIGIVPYALPGSISLADATLEQIKTHDVVLWEKHGTLSVGTDIMDAFDQTDVLCKAANIYMCARSMGSEPDGMTEKDMKEIQDVFNLPRMRPC